jgi:hypothetical protein
LVASFRRVLGVFGSCFRRFLGSRPGRFPGSLVVCRVLGVLGSRVLGVFGSRVLGVFGSCFRRVLGSRTGRFTGFLVACRFREIPDIARFVAPGRVRRSGSHSLR